VPFGTPLYDAGVDQGDVVVTVDGRPATLSAWNALSKRGVGERVPLTVRRRDGRVVETAVTPAADPRVVVSPVEATGGSLSPAQRARRAAWLGTNVK
jgi:predicted metalloprotease with PDZ domain